ncbi:MAG: nuclear transport factor 2 family protein [Sphingomonas bacterium]
MSGFSKHLKGGAALAAVAVLSAAGFAALPAAAQTAPNPPKVELRGLERLLAMEDMKNLRLTFCRSLDNHNWAALRGTMADDFDLYFGETKGPGGPDVRPPVQLKGADKFVDFAKQLLKGQSIHICTMPQFQYVGADRARALWFINGYGNIGEQSGLGFERVVEDYVKVNGKWLISRADARVEANVQFPK